MMAKFLCDNLLHKDVEIYFGGGPGERLRGKVMGSSGGVLMLEYQGRTDYINGNKILAVWEI